MSENVYRRCSIEELIPDASVVQAGSYERAPAHLVGGSDGIRDAFDALQADSPVDLGRVASGVLRDVTVVGGGMTLTDDGHAVAETLNCLQNLPEYRGFKRGDDLQTWTTTEPLEITQHVAAVPGRQHLLLKSAWDTNYGHWLVDTLSRLQLGEGIGLEDRPLFVVNKQTAGMQKVVEDSLAMAGYGPEDMVVHDFEPRRYESLAILGSLSMHPAVKSTRAMDHLADLTSEIPAGDVERIYLSRNTYSRRRLLNEDLLWPLFERRGFQRVTPESLSLREQVSLFRGARVVAGNLGAAFSSLAFSPDGVQAIALTTPAMEHDFFYDLVCLKRGTYWGVQGINSQEAPNLGSDFYVEGHSLNEVLDQLD